MAKKKSRRNVFIGLGIVMLVIVSLVFTVFNPFQQTSLNVGDEFGGVETKLAGGLFAVSVDDYNSRSLSSGFVQQSSLGAGELGENVLIFAVDEEPNLFQKFFGLFNPIQQSVAWNELSDTDKALHSSGDLVITEEYANSQGYGWIDTSSTEVIEQRFRDNPDLVAFIGEKDDDNVIPISYKDKFTGEINHVSTIAYRTQLDFVGEEFGGASWTLKETAVFNPDTGYSVVMTDRDPETQTYTKTGGLVYNDNLELDAENWCAINPLKCIETKTQALLDSSNGLFGNSDAPKEDVNNNGVPDVNEESNFWLMYGVPLGVLLTIIVIVIVVLLGKRKKVRK